MFEENHLQNICAVEWLQTALDRKPTILVGISAWWTTVSDLITG
jgi:hypothetical protein